ncbi:hypothetical protein N431DRAFT_473238 [Stipitochalara longipes BDJ]|nr:hypothetical protein N431DRAFT_473238 [Stipitochalara longipes BDJ]
MSCSCCSHDSKEKTFEPFIDRFTLLLKCRLDNGPRRLRYRQGEVYPYDREDSSKLQSLPIELYQACLSYLDVATLTAMRRVSQYTRGAIDSLYQYQELYEYAPQALRACLCTGVGSHIPLRRLHHALTSMECYYCKISDDPQSTFGAYLSLYEGRRTCLFCLRNNPILKPVELMTLITLRCQKNSTLGTSPTTSFPIITTIPGHYSPISSTAPRKPRTSLLRAYSITSHPEQTLNDKERLALFGNSRTAVTNHHPLISPADESDINPAANYIAPETPKQISHFYMSAIIFPYLPTSKTLVDYGVLCADCCLHMRYEEHRWKEEQRTRRMNGQDPTASLRTRDRINAARKKACRMYTTTLEAFQDHCSGEDSERKWKEASVQMTIQSHRASHGQGGLILSRGEVEWRKSVKGAALPLLGHDRFG